MGNAVSASDDGSETQPSSRSGSALSSYGVGGEGSAGGAAAQPSASGGAASASSFASQARPFPPGALATPQALASFLGALGTAPVFQVYASAALAAGLTGPALVALGAAQARSLLGLDDDDVHAAAVAKALAAEAARAAADGPVRPMRPLVHLTADEVRRWLEALVASGALGSGLLPAAEACAAHGIGGALLPASDDAAAAFPALVERLGLAGSERRVLLRSLVVAVQERIREEGVASLTSHFSAAAAAAADAAAEADASAASSPASSAGAAAAVPAAAAAVEAPARGANAGAANAGLEDGDGEDDDDDDLPAPGPGRSVTNARNMSFSEFFEYNPAEGGRDFVAKGSTCDVFLCRPRAGAQLARLPFVGALPERLCVKVYRRDVLRATPDFIHKVIDREYTALSATRHANIVRMVHTFKERAPGVPDGEYSSVYVVQEFCPGLPADQALLDALAPAEKQRAVETGGGGPELYRYFMQRPRLGDAALRYILYQLLSAVMCIHELDPPMVHRDLKPENVAVWREIISAASGGARVPCVKLMDFGMTRAVPVEDRIRQLRNDMEGTLMTANTGTATYMAPEVRRIVAQEGPDGEVVPASPRAVAAAAVPGPDGNVPIVSTNLALYDWRYDIYSLGVLLFVLGTKSVPGPAGLHRDRGAQNRATAHLSADALDLLQHMVSELPQNRPSARMCLQHRWFNPIREEVMDLLGDDTLLRVVGRG